MKKSKQALSNLNKLLVINYETERVFLSVLDQAENPLLKNFLRVAGYERNQFIKSLDSSIRQKGITPTYPEDSLKTDVKLSSGLRKKISSNDNQSALNEIGKIQIKDIEKYKKILNNTDFPDDLEKSLSKQLDTIVNSLYSIEVHKDLLSRNPNTISI